MCFMASATSHARLLSSKQTATFDGIWSLLCRLVSLSQPTTTEIEAGSDCSGAAFRLARYPGLGQ